MIVACIKAMSEVGVNTNELRIILLKMKENLNSKDTARTFLLY